MITELDYELSSHFKGRFVPKNSNMTPNWHKRVWVYWVEYLLLGYFWVLFHYNNAMTSLKGQVKYIRMPRSPDNHDSFIIILLTLYSICLVMADHTQLKLDIRKWKFKLPIVSLSLKMSHTKAYHTILFRRFTFHVTFLKAKAVM